MGAKQIANKCAGWMSVPPVPFRKNKTILNYINIMGKGNHLQNETPYPINLEKTRITFYYAERNFI